MKLVIFDFDGTLFDTRRDIANAVNAARKRFSQPELPLECVTEMVGDGVSILAQRAFSGTGVDLTEATREIMEHYTRHPAEYAQPYPGVCETLPLIPQIKVILSNKPEALVQSILTKFHLGRYFEFVAGGETFPRKKPDPMAVDYLSERFHLGPGEMLMVGDHSPDMEMARRAGLTSVYCNYGFFGRDRLGADYSIDCFAQIQDVLAALSSQNRQKGRPGIRFRRGSGGPGEDES